MQPNAKSSKIIKERVRKGILFFYSFLLIILSNEGVVFFAALLLYEQIIK